MELPIEEYFTYHPPQTESRKLKHEQIGNSALAFARIVNEIKDENCRKMALFAIQQARMFANQGITIDELREHR
jgi:hypothetical protein